MSDNSNSDTNSAQSVQQLDQEPIAENQSQEENSVNQKSKKKEKAQKGTKKFNSSKKEKPQEDSSSNDDSEDHYKIFLGGLPGSTTKGKEIV